MGYSASAPLRPLPRVHALQQREPAMGFASRLAALHGVGLRTLCTEMAIPYADLQRGESSALDDLCVLGRLDRDAGAALHRFSPRRLLASKRYGIGAEQFSDKFVRAGRFGYCPHCVAEDLNAFDDVVEARPWLRLEWIMTHVRSCRIHGTLLSETQLTNYSARFDFAKDVAEQVVPNIDEARRTTQLAPWTEFEDYVIRRLEGRHSGIWLDDVPLGAAVYSCETMGLAASRGPLSAKRDLTPRDWQAVAARGYAIASEGEAGIVSLLNDLVRNQKPGSRIDAYVGTYGCLYVLMRSTLRDPAYDKLRAIVRRHAIENFPIMAGCNFLGEVLPVRKVHSAGTAALASGVNERTIRRIFRNREDRDGMAPLRISADEVALVSEALGNALSEALIYQTFGIPKRQMRLLIADGWLPTFNGDYRRPGDKLIVGRREVEALMERLFDGAVPVEVPLPHQVTIFVASQRRKIPTRDIHALILDRRLTWKGYTGARKDFGNLLVDMGEVVEILGGPSLPLSTRKRYVRRRKPQ